MPSFWPGHHPDHYDPMRRDLLSFLVGLAAGAAPAPWRRAARGGARHADRASGKNVRKATSGRSPGPSPRCRGHETCFGPPFLKWLTLSSPWRRRRPPFCHSHRGSGFARSVSLFFALVVASHARRRMNGVEGWGRHLRCGSRGATQAVQRAHPPIELREFPTPHRRADPPGGRAMRRPRCEARGQAVWVRTGCRHEAARRGFRPGAAPTRRRR